MNRTWLIVIAVLIAIGAYWQFSYVPTQRAAEEAAAAAEAEARAAEAEAAAAAAAAEAEAAAAAAATEAATAVEEAATDAATAVEGAVEDAATALEGAATEAAPAVEGAATDAATAVEGAAEAVGDTAGMVWDATRLTAEEVIARIEAAPISQSVKETLAATYRSVQNSPDAAQAVLDQLRQAMGQ